MGLEKWQTCLRNGFFRAVKPNGSRWVSDNALWWLRDLLERDDPRLIQGAVTEPPPLSSVLDWPADKACFAGQCAIADGLTTVGEVEEFFTELCSAADRQLGEPAGARFFLNRFDDEPRSSFWPKLLIEVRLEQARREKLRPVRVEVARERERCGAAGMVRVAAGVR